MAILYSYPETLELLPADMLIGTSTIRVAGKKKNITKNFTLELLKSFILDGNTGVQWGTITGTLSNQTDLQAALNTKQGSITLTTTGSSGPATFASNVLNIPDYSTGAAVPTLNQVLTAGNTSLLNAKIGELYLYDTTEIDYGHISLNDSDFNFYDVYGISAKLNRSAIVLLGVVGGFYGTLLLPAVTANRTYTLPNATGTIALTSDIPTLTTTGNSGSSTLIGGVLNVPTYTLAGLGGISLTSLSSTATGLTYTNTTGVFSLTSGYLIPTTASYNNANWDSAYTNRITSLTTTGTGAATLVANVLNIPTPPAATFTSLTTTGSSGSSTLTTGVLNVPTYTLTGLGGVPTSRTLTINGVAQDLSSDRTWSVGTVTSVGLTMPSAFSVANSPVTGAGTLAVTGAGVASQYVRGDGTLANFPTSTGGGASVSYYLNGSISQGTIGGVAYKEINSVPVIGTGTDFTINADGYIAQFITDVGDPNKLLIPSGNWNFETYFSASSGGGSPRFYIELYKYDGTTFTLIASNSATPENITGGTSIDLYFTALAIPPTTLLATDRLAVRFYVIHSGRTITMHTENSHLSQIITTFSTGLTALNGLTSQVQYFAVGTSGTDFNISSVTDTHTFNLPTASASNRGALSSTDYSFFFNKQPTLVNGTNIRGINGYSLLGSGGLTILGIHALIKPYSGLTYSASINQSAIGSASAQTANRLIVYPFIPANTFTCSSMYINVATLSIGALCQIVIYSDLNGFPDQKLYNSTDLDCSTTGKKTATTTQTFNAGTAYWIGTHSSSIASLTVISGAGLISPYIQNVSAGTAYIGTATYGSPPNPFGTTANTTGVVPFVGITV
jgi:hypothetical protein